MIVIKCWGHLTDNIRRNYKVWYYSSPALHFLFLFASFGLVTSPMWWNVIHGSLVFGLSALVLSAGQPSEEWRLTKVGHLICYLIVGIRNITEWTSNGGDLMQNGRGCLCGKRFPFDLRSGLFWEPLHPLLEAGQNSHKSSYAGKNLVGKVTFAWIEWSSREENPFWLSRGSGREEEPHEGLALLSSTLILLLCLWAQYLWKGMLVTAQKGSAPNFLIDQDLPCMLFMCKGLGI